MGSGSFILTRLDSFMYETWRIRLWDMTHSYMGHGSFTYETGLIHFETWLIHFEMWRFHSWDMTHLYGIWRIHRLDMTLSYMRYWHTHTRIWDVCGVRYVCAINRTHAHTHTLSLSRTDTYIYTIYTLSHTHTLTHTGLFCKRGRTPGGLVCTRDLTREDSSPARSRTCSFGRMWSFVFDAAGILRGSRAHMFICMNIYIYTFLDTYIYIRTYLNVYIYTYIYTSEHIYVYINIHKSFTHILVNCAGLWTIRTLQHISELQCASGCYVWWSVYAVCIHVNRYIHTHVCIYVYAACVHVYAHSQCENEIRITAALCLAVCI